MSLILKALPLAWVFIKFLPKFIAWAHNTLEDSYLSVEELEEGIVLIWPSVDEHGNPKPIKIPWTKSKQKLAVEAKKSEVDNYFEVSKKEKGPLDDHSV